MLKINVCYWREKVQGSYNVKQRFPCFLLTEGEESNEHIYGLPSNEYPGLVKVRHDTGPSSVYRKETLESLKRSWLYEVDFKSFIFLFHLFDFLVHQFGIIIQH